MAAVRLIGIEKRFATGPRVLQGIDLDVQPGEFVVFVGPSGSGKSTLLRIIAGLEDPDAGEVRIGELLANDVPASRRGIAMVFQSYALYPHMSVHDNMAFALRMAGTPKQEVTQRVRRSAEILQITNLLDRKPKTLSGGQRQRVAIGRAIVREPRVFLFDEPLSNLDAALRQEMRVELSRLHQDLGTTMVYVTHDQVEAMTLASRIVVFDRGVVQQVGTPQALYDAPANLFVAGFLGAPKMNFIPAALLPGAPAAAVTVGIRPEHLRLAVGEEPGTLAARVRLLEFLGDHLLLHATLDGLAAALCVKLAARNDLPASGDTVRLRLPPERCLHFDHAGLALPRPA